jgi:hypothetical protein
MLTGLDLSFAHQGFLFFGFRGRSSPAGLHARGGSGSHQHTSAGNAAGDPSAAIAASSASTSSPPSATAEEVLVAFAPTV